MDWSYSLLLVNPVGRRYRPAPALDSPLVREERRSWRAALQASRTSTGRPLSSDSTPPSDTAAAA